MKQNIVLLCVLSFFIQNYCMLSVGGKRSCENCQEGQQSLQSILLDVAGCFIVNLDYKSNIQFIRTSTALYQSYKDKDELFTDHYLPSDYYNSAMIFFARKGDIKKFNLLMQHEGPINKKNREDIRSYFEIQNAQQLVDIYKRKYDEKNIYDQEKELTINPYHIPNNIAILQLLIQQGYNPYVPGYKNWSVCNHAVYEKRIKTLKFVSTYSHLDPNFQDDEGKSLLHETADKFNLRFLQFLLADPRVDRNIQDRYGRSIMHYCSSRSLDGMLFLKSILADPLVDINAQDKDGLTALHWCARQQNKDKEMIKTLLNQPKLDQHIKDNDGKTAMHYMLEDKIIHGQYFKS